MDFYYIDIPVSGATRFENVFFFNCQTDGGEGNYFLSTKFLRVWKKKGENFYQ